jgi:hypothetical protein
MMKLKAHQQNLAFHLPGVRKKGLGQGRMSQECLACYSQSLSWTQLAKDSHTHGSLIWQPDGSKPRKRHCDECSAAGHILVLNRRKGTDKISCPDKPLVGLVMPEFDGEARTQGQRIH